jgi:multiple sugar transport system substrate-binding protein
MRDRSLSRRRFLKAAAVGATTLAVAPLSACGGTTAPSSPTAAGGAATARAAPTAIDVLREAAPTIEAPEATAATGAKVTGQVELAYYNWGPSSIQYFKGMAGAFEKAHPGTEIKLTLPPFEQYETKLKILLSTGRGPDIVTTTGLTQRLFKQNRLLDLTARTQLDPLLLDPQRFIQSGWDVYRFGTGRTYGIYSGADTLLLYYNKGLFDKAGVEHPTPDWTWNDFVGAAKELTVTSNGKTTQWGTVLGAFVEWWGWENLVWMEGGDIVDQRPFYTRLTLNNEPVIKVLQFLQDMVYKHKVAPAPAQAASVAEQGGFETGKVAMLVDGGWGIQSRKAIKAFEWDVEMLPKGPEGFFGEFWPGTPMQISAQTKNPDLAWEFVRWFAASKEAQELIAKQLIQVPARLDVALSPTFLTQPGMPKNARAWVKSLERAKPADILHERQQELMDKVWTPNWQKFQANKINPREFATTVESEGNKLLRG